MRRSVRRPLFTVASLLALATAGCVLLAPPLKAEWLVLRDGSKIETTGAPTLRGRLVVFKTKDGTLSSLRSEEVDVAATERANDPAVAAAHETQQAEADASAKAAKASRPPVLVLGEDDLGKVDASDLANPEDGDTSGASGDDSASEADTTADRPSVAVIDWEHTTINEGVDLEVVGTVRNDSEQTVTVRGVRVALFDDDGRLLANALGPVRNTDLPPKQTTTFRASFPGLTKLSAARFRVEVAAAQGSDEEPEPPAPPSS